SFDPRVDLLDPPCPGRAVGSDRDRTYGLQPVMSFEVVVGVVEDDVGPGLDGRELLRQLAIEPADPFRECICICGIETGARRVGRPERGSYRPRHRDRILWVEPYMTITARSAFVRIAIPGAAPACRQQHHALRFCESDGVGTRCEVGERGGEKV